MRAYRHSLVGRQTRKHLRALSFGAAEPKNRGSEQHWNPLVVFPFLRLEGLYRGTETKETRMRNLLLSIALSVAFAGGAYAQSSTSPGTSGSGSTTQMSQAECTSTWNSLNASGSGDLSQTQAQRAINDFSSADTNKDGKLSQAEFMSACQRGLVSSGSGSRALSPGTGGTTTPGGTTK